ncbi:MAG: shikimate dehydrogenase [Candidatus Thorarchaeota archaeon]
MKQLVVAGNPIDHSLSPIMHNAALETLELDWEYCYDRVLLQKADLRKFVESIESGLINGANITLPFKTSVIPYLSNITKEAEVVGAVNTIYRKDSDVIGSNTDVQGFLNVLHENDVDLEGSCVTIIGAGGVARAVAFALVSKDISILKILNRTKLNAEKLVTSIKQVSDVNLQSGSLTSFGNSEDEIDLLINCTSIGMVGQSIGKSPVDKNLMSSNTVVMDLVYNPMRTKLLEDAVQIGCRVIDGVGMLLHQGALSFESWTGLKPPLNVMRKALLQVLEVTDNGP